MYPNYGMHIISSGKNYADFLTAPYTRIFGDATKNYSDCMFAFFKCRMMMTTTMTTMIIIPTKARTVLPGLAINIINQ